MADNPIEPFKALGLKMQALAASLGCDMATFVIAPDLNGDENLVQVIFVLPDLESHPDDVSSSTAEEDAMVAELLASIEEHESDSAAKAVDDDTVQRALDIRRKLGEG